MYFSQVVDDIQDKLTQHRLSGGESLWATIIEQIVREDSFDGRHADRILEYICAFLKQLDDKTIFSLWRETEVGMGDDSEDDCLFADSCRMDLEMELLQQTTDLAWQEAEEVKKAAAKKRTSKQKGVSKKKPADQR